MKRGIVWFKTDLRLLDNETLVQAIAQSDEIIPVYCFDEAHFVTTSLGFKKTVNFRTQFLFEALTDLDKNLRAIGSGLIIVKGKPEVEIFKLAEKYNAQKVFAKKETAFEELATESKVSQELMKINCVLETYDTSTLYMLSDLPFAVKDIPDVFTDFRKRVEAGSEIRPIFHKPTDLQSPEISEPCFPTFDELELDALVYDSRSVLDFKGGESEGNKRLFHYLYETHAIATYKQTRNGLTGANYSSKFSSWLSLGCLSPRLIYHEIKRYELGNIANESTYWLVFELLWRDFFVFMMCKYPFQYFLINGINKRNPISFKHDEVLFQMWLNGATDNDFINANMKELKLTGFMSNRGRQNVASYLCHNLKLDWRYGAAYFEQQLIDYDVCSNWGNWAYIAGVGNNPRNITVFNTDKQADEYDNDKSYRKLWLNRI